jgi:hypothetical protein
LETKPKAVAGFTGTQEGMTREQRIAVTQILDEKKVTEMHHGDCVGADSEAHQIAQRAATVHRIVIHPSNTEYKRAFCTLDWLGYSGGVHILSPKHYLDRNRDIVEESSFLIAAPKGFSEELRSGTWATVRHARKLKRKIYIVFLDGRVVQEN